MSATSRSQNDSVENTAPPAENSAVATSNNAEQPVQQPQQQQQQQQQQRFSKWGMFKSFAVRMVIIYVISSYFRRPAQQPSSTNSSGQPATSTSAPMQAMNLYSKLTSMDLYIYISEGSKFQDFNNKDKLYWFEEELAYGDWTGGSKGDGLYEKSFSYIPSDHIQNNGTFFLHLYIVKNGLSPDPKDANYDTHCIYKSTQLNRYKKRKFHQTANLLTGEANAPQDLIRKPNETKFEILSHWHPNLTINMIDDHTPWIRGSVPPPLDEFIHFVPESNFYYPIVYFNTYWNLNQDYMPINNTVSLLNFTLTFSPMSLFKWQMYAAQGMKNRWYSFLGDDMAQDSDDDQDTLKQTLLETNPYLLGLTILISIVHSVFEFLAFKNDIQFWKNRKSLEGLSVRSVFFNVFQSLVVLLYILDNETNFVVKCSVFIGLLIEIWKITKVVDLKLNFENKIFGVFPKIIIKDKSSYVESDTRKYDKLAFRYLSWFLFPLLGAYALYSLFYQEHRGWYSWILGMLYGFLLTFGFIMMTPQLFINYKLKSVAHLPWRMLTYKSLNTFIDDLFAFVIKMPTLYRLGCFRDDIVFVIYCYQRYIYKVDPKRVNEFGVSQEMLEKTQSENSTEVSSENKAISDSQEPIKSNTDKKDD